MRELGFGQFGTVWLAEAIGISAFHPRDMLRERTGGRRFSFLPFFDRTGKRNSYIYCKQVSSVAVKTIKGLIFIGNLVLHSHLHVSGIITDLQHILTGSFPSQCQNI